MMDGKAERVWGGDQSVAISHPRKGLKGNENSKVGLKYMRSSLKYDAAILQREFVELMATSVKTFSNEVNSNEKSVTF